MNKRHGRECGAVIAEGAAAMILIVPLLMMLIYVAMESSYAYLIKSTLSEAAREASRNLAIAYGLDTSVAGNRALENARVFDRIRINNMVNSSAQFEDPVWNTAVDPPTVTVNVKYLGNQYGLPPFPNPDVLQLGNNFVIAGSSTYRLQ